MTVLDDNVPVDEKGAPVVVDGADDCEKSAVDDDDAGFGEYDCSTTSIPPAPPDISLLLLLISK